VKIDETEIVEGRYYSTDHVWVKVEDKKVRVGVSDYAQKQLRELLVVDLLEAGSTVEQSKPFATVESVKVVVDVISPLSGVVVEINDELRSNPRLINEDPFGKGWLVVIEPSNLGDEMKRLMDFDKAIGWHKTFVK